MHMHHDEVKGSNIMHIRNALLHEKLYTEELLEGKHTNTYM
jgi:hypothetical protein